MCLPRLEQVETAMCIPISPNGLCELVGVKHLAFGETHPCQPLAKQWAKCLSGGAEHWSWKLSLLALLQHCVSKVRLLRLSVA